MNAGAVRKHDRAWRGLAVLGVFSALCTTFVLVATVAQGWQEHVQAQWPEVTAVVQRCGVGIYVHRPESYWIDCSISYVAGGTVVVSHVHSRSTPAPRRVISKHPDWQLGLMQGWVDRHPPGTPIGVHYDPAHREQTALLATDMPLGGARTPDNLKLLAVVGATSALLLALCRIMRPKESLQA